MPITDISIYRRRADIVAEMLATLVAAIPDAYIGEDGNWYIKFTIEAGQLENLYLAHQILLQDMFITTASAQALARHGEQYKFPPKAGTVSTGTLTFEGAGGTYIPVGAEAAYDAGGGVPVIFFTTTIDGTVPNPGDPAAPTIASAGSGSGLAAGTYEYAVTFVTASGETELGDPSNTLVKGTTNSINVTAIPTGGTGTTARRLYRRKDGGAWGLLASASASLNNNSTTTYTDTGDVASSLPPVADTAHKITLAAASQDVGVESNVAIGTITVLTNAPADLIGVTNLVAFTGASDPEDTEDYRRRLLQYIQSPGTGSPLDLQVIAESISGVESATIFEDDPSPGMVMVRISGPNGTVPGSTVIDAVQAALDAYDIANTTIDVDTFIPQVENVTVGVTLEGSYTIADVEDSVEAAITAYFATLSVGETLRVAGIIDAVFGLAGIADVTVTTPSGNVACSANEKITPGTITVT